MKMNFLKHTDAICQVIPNVLRPDECKQWIADFESREFKPATITTANGTQKLDTSYRKCQRLILEDDAKIQLLTERLGAYLGNLPNRGTMLNPLLRVLKYEPGDFFHAHTDENCRAVPGKISYWTLQLYLNDDFQGGGTTFLDFEGNTTYKPVAGSALLFDQDLLHQGDLLESGIKYTVRTDILCDR